MEEENKAYMQENMALKEFKANVEKEQFNFAVDQTLKEIEGAVEIPKDELLALKEESKNFSIDTVDAYKNLAKARAFGFATKGKKENEEKEIEKLIQKLSPEGVN